MKRGVHNIAAGVRSIAGGVVPGKMFLLYNVRKKWAEIVGEGIASHSWPGSIRDGVLLVYVDDPVWSSELTLHRDDILGSIRNYFEGSVKSVSSIRFRTGTVKKNEDAPAVEPLPEIDGKTLERIDNALRNVADEELKESLRSYLIRINLGKNDKNDKD